MDDFMIRALVAGLLVAMIGGFLGCIVVWRRLSYVSDCLSHSIIPGVALGFMYSLNLYWSAFFTAIIIALSIERIKNNIRIPLDAVLVIISQIMFSIGVIIIYMNADLNRDLMSFLLGDILTVSYADILTIAACAATIITFLLLKWRNIVILCLDEDIALSEGINIKVYNTVIMLLTAAFTAFSLQTVGIILAGSLLLIPVAAARLVCRSTKEMPFVSVFYGCVGVIAGISLSFFYDIPTSPAIVICLTIILLLNFILKK